MKLYSERNVRLVTVQYKYRLLFCDFPGPATLRGNICHALLVSAPSILVQKFTSLGNTMFELSQISRALDETGHSATIAMALMSDRN